MLVSLTVFKRNMTTIGVSSQKNMLTGTSFQKDIQIL